jgi:hypothetical protein
MVLNIESNGSDVQNSRAFVLPVENLTADVDGSDVTLKWDPSSYAVVPGIISHHKVTPESPQVGIGGIGGAGEFMVAARFSPEQLFDMRAAGGELYGMAFLMYGAAVGPPIVTHTNNYTMRVWLVEPGGTPGTPVINQFARMYNEAAVRWFEGEFETPLIIPFDKELWVGVHITTTGGQPIGQDLDGPVVQGYGNKIWRNATQGWVNNTGNRNWAIDGDVDVVGGGRITLGSGRVRSLAASVTPVIEDYTMSNTNFTTYSPRSSRALLGFEVYRDGALQTPTMLPASQTTFTQTGLQAAVYVYSVVAVYSDGKADPVYVDAVVGMEVFNPPLDFEAFSDNNKIALTWAKPEESIATLAGYRVFRDGVDASGLITTLTFTDVDRLNGMLHKYFVRAYYVSPTGASAPTATIEIAAEGETIFPFPPTNLVGRHEDGEVFLNWDKPEFVPGEWITHTQSERGNALGLVDPPNPPGTPIAYQLTVGHRYTPAQLEELGVVGRYIERVKFMAESRPASYTVRVFTGGSWIAPRNPGTQRAQVIVPANTITVTPALEWYEVILPTRVLITGTEEVWITYLANVPLYAENQSASLDQGPTLADFGNILFMNNNWITLNAPGVSNIQGNWMIQGLVGWGDGSGQTIAIGATPEPVNTVDEPMVYTGPVEFSLSNVERQSGTRNARTFLGYYIFRDGSRINDTPIRTESFTDPNAPAGANPYFVVAYYDGIGPSEPSNTVSVTVAPRATVTVTRTVPWEEDFENGPRFTQLFTLRAGAGTTRNFTRNIQFGYNSQSSATSLSQQGTNKLNPDAYLITPRIVLPIIEAGDEVILQFMAGNRGTTASNNFHENYSVLISTTDSNQISAFTEVLLTEKMDYAGWEQKRIDLTRFASTTETRQIILAFRHHAVPVDLPSHTIAFDNLWVGIDGVSEFEETTVKPQTALRGNFPNPFNPETSIAFTMAAEGNVSIEIFNIRGQRVTTLLNENREAGNHHVVWKGTDDYGRNVGSGIYLYRMTTGDFSTTRRMVLMK